MFNGISISDTNTIIPRIPGTTRDFTLYSSITIRVKKTFRSKMYVFMLDHFDIYSYYILTFYIPNIIFLTFIWTYMTFWSHSENLIVIFYVESYFVLFVYNIILNYGLHFITKFCQINIVCVLPNRFCLICCNNILHFLLMVYIIDHLIL